MWIFRAALPCVLGLTFCLRLPAPLIPGPNLAERIQKADAIVVAKVISGASTASGSEVSNDFTLHVERVLKGGLIADTDAAVHLEERGYWNVPDTRQTSIQGELYGIWFLNTATHPYAVLSRDGTYGELYWAPVNLPEAAPAAKPGDTPAASVANELAAALRWTAADNTKDARGRLYSLLEDLRSLDSSITLPIYKVFASDPAPSVRAIGIQGLIASNDPDGVKRAASEWTELAATADVNPIINALTAYSNATDPDAVRALGALALRDHPESGLRENAAYALRSIHTRETLPTLVALLDQPNSRVLSNALSGLCLFVRSAPTIAPPERYCLLGGTPPGDVDVYVTFWKAWWNEHNREIEGR